MPRDTIELEIPTGASSAGNGPERHVPQKTFGVSHVHVGGIWGNGERMKVQYCTDARVDQADAWTDAAGGNITGVAATWVKRTENIPEEVLFVRIVTLDDITPDATYPPIARHIFDEGAPG